MGYIAAGMIGSALIGGALSSAGASKQQQASQDMAREQMRFQERMSSTAHQRAAADLEKAGLNRVLALGAPASSPAGAMGQAQNIYGTGVSSALATAQAGASAALTAQQARRTKYEADIIKPKADAAGAAGKITGDLAEGFEGTYPRIKSEAKATGRTLGNWYNSAKSMFDGEPPPKAKLPPISEVRDVKRESDIKDVLDNANPRLKKIIADTVDKMDVDTTGWTQEDKIRWGLRNLKRVRAFMDRNR